jgi:hypothetical protein
MKRTTFSYIAVAAVLFLAACTKDNYTAPSSQLTGKVVFQGEAIGVRSNGVQLELWQRGYQLFTKIPVYIAQDGSFAATLFDGDYKLVRLRGNGPWADNSDSINVTVRGNTVMDVPVDPFFVIKNATFQKSGADVTATFTVQAVNTTRTLELVRIYVGQTLITDQNNSAANAQKLAAAVTLGQPVTLNVTVPAALAAKDYLYVRVGVKANGVAELAYSACQKLQLK